jgi:hypothetical protein
MYRKYIKFPKPADKLARSTALKMQIDKLFFYENNCPLPKVLLQMKSLITLRCEKGLNVIRYYILDRLSLMLYVFKRKWGSWGQKVF